MAKEFELNVRFVFDGKVTVKAKNRSEAKEQIEKHFGLVIGGDLHTAIPEIIDWSFSVHPTKKVVK